MEVFSNSMKEVQPFGLSGIIQFAIYWPLPWMMACHLKIYVWSDRHANHEQHHSFLQKPRLHLRIYPECPVPLTRHIMEQNKESPVTSYIRWGKERKISPKTKTKARLCVMPSGLFEESQVTIWNQTQTRKYVTASSIII